MCIIAHCRVIEWTAFVKFKIRHFHENGRISFSNALEFI